MHAAQFPRAAASGGDTGPLWVWIENGQQSAFFTFFFLACCESHAMNALDPVKLAHVGQ